MKKILSILLIFACLLSITVCFACCDSKDQNESEGTTATTTTTSSENKNDNNKPDSGNETPDKPNEEVDFVALLNTLLQGYQWNPTSIIPETMTPESLGNLYKTDSAYPTPNYSDFVEVSKLPTNGIGEQWNMAIENISEAQRFFLALSVIDNISSASVAAFNNYIDENPAETAHYVWQSGIYSVTIHCTQDTVNYVVEYIVSGQTIQMALSMDLATQSKHVRIQLGDANAVAYTIEKDHYTFAINYLDVDLENVDVGRRAFFEIIENSDGSITAHIYEYITASALEIASIADVYITEDYVTVVGNKASGMAVFEGTICELYSVATGKMIAYEVKESTEVLDITVTYNTLWFDLEDVNGITSIKYIPKTSVNEKDKAYINGSSNIWSAKNYGLSGGAKAASRRFDIEFRTQYFYYYDSANDSYEKIKIAVPMLFVQEEVFDDLTNDVRDKNDVTISINVSPTNLTKLKNEYHNKADLLEQNKEKYSVSAILEYIGDKKVFS